jgi:tetratricopeptide (TPR) repeat protein
MLLPGMSWQLAIIGAAGFTLLAYNVWTAWERRQLRRRMVMEGKLQAKPRRRPWNASNILMAVVAIGSAIAFLYLGSRYGPGMAMLFLSPFFIAGVFVSVWIQRAMGDSVLYAVEKLWQQKQIEQAITYLRCAIHAKDTADRSQTLSVLLLSVGAVDEAAQYAQRAVDLGANAPKYEANKAMVIAKAGNLPEALSLMASVRQREPQELLFACQYCSLLADAERWDEAHEQLRQSEALSKVAMDEQQQGESYWLAGPLLQQCRDRVGGSAPRGFPIAVVRDDTTTPETETKR